MNILLNNRTEFSSNEKAEFNHFTQDDKPYTFIVTKSTVPIIFFVKGYHTDLNFGHTDIVFKNTFNMVEFANFHNIKVEDKLKEKNHYYKPKYSDITDRSALFSYSGLDKTSFKDFTLLLNDGNAYGDEMFNLYCLEYEIVKHTIAFLFKDLYEELGHEKFQSIKKMRSMNSSGLFFRINDLLVDNMDRWLTVIQFIDDDSVLYFVDKDLHLDSFSDEDRKSNRIAFSNNDILKRTTEVAEELKPYIVGKISNDSSYFDMQLMFETLSSIKNTNKYLSKKKQIFNNAKKVKPTELNDPVYDLLFNSYYFWLEGEIYNPNKVIGVDFSAFKNELKPYLEENDYTYCTTIINSLMTSYKADISKEWLTIVQQAIEKVKDLNSIPFENSNHNEIENIADQNICIISKHYNKIMLRK